MHPCQKHPCPKNEFGPKKNIGPENPPKHPCQKKHRPGKSPKTSVPEKASLKYLHLGPDRPDRTGLSKDRLGPDRTGRLLR